MIPWNGLRDIIAAKSPHLRTVLVLSELVPKSDVQTSVTKTLVERLNRSFFAFPDRSGWRSNLEQLVKVQKKSRMFDNIDSPYYYTYNSSLCCTFKLEKVVCSSCSLHKNFLLLYNTFFQLVRRTWRHLKLLKILK